MRRLIAQNLVLSCSAALLASCTTVQATHRGAVAYNKSFADARNELIVLNVLRASQYQLLQFSTISQVSGLMRAEMKAGAELDNLLLGAANIFKPSGELGLRNPSVTIQPLDGKEFRQGMLTPLSAQTVDELIRQGFDEDVVLNLVLEKVVCAGSLGARGVVIDNPESWSFKKQSNRIISSVYVPAEDVPKTLREGAGDGRKTLVAPAERQKRLPRSVLIDISEDGETFVTLSTSSCGVASGVKSFSTRPDIAGYDSSKGHKLLFRSPMSIFMHLGKMHQGRKTNRFFVINEASASATANLAPIRVRWNKKLHYIAPSSDADKSMQTLSVLGEILALQTSGATLQANNPALVVIQ